jgi:hypothetical protein
MTRTFAQTGPLQPLKARKYAELATQLPLDPREKAQLYIYWGDVVKLANAGVRGQALAAVRREAVVPYLRSLKEALPHDLPKEMPDLPAVSLFTYTGPEDDPVVQAARARRAEQLAAREKAEFQRDMILMRDTASEHIAFMYSRLPFATEELQKTAKQILGDQDAVDELLLRVDARIQKRLDNMGAVVLHELPEDLDRQPPFEAGEQDLEVTGVSGAKSSGETGLAQNPGQPQHGQVAGVGTGGVPYAWVVGLASALLAVGFVWLRTARAGRSRGRAS